MSDALQAGGWVWRGIGTWWKPGIRMQRGAFSSSCEFVVWGTNGPLLDHDGAPQNVTTCAPIRTASKSHIAQKPPAVMEWCLSIVPPGSLVVDPFMGSGTTLAAAKALGFRAIGIDIGERDCETAARRCAQAVILPPAAPRTMAAQAGIDYQTRGD